MGSCRQCGAVEEGGRFCTRCGSLLAVPAASTPRSVRPIWFVAGVLLLVVASAFTTLAVIRYIAVEDSPSPADDTTMPLDPTVIVLDASSSMRTEDAPGPRIDAAKNAVNGLVESLPDDTPLGLIVYGTSTDGSPQAKEAGCQDIRTLVPFGPLDRTAFAATVSGVVPSGYTPIGGALRAAVAELPADGPRNVVLVSDGDDTCTPPPPCEVAAELAAPGLAVHTVGFRVDATARDQLSCIAGATGGIYVDADNAAQLSARLRSAVDPNTAVNTLTRNGFDGLELGMSLEDAKAVDPAIADVPVGTARIPWRDGELTFTDGKLTGISTPTVGTQDGLAVGDDVSRAVELYGDGVVQPGPGDLARLTVPTGDGGESGYAITFDPARVADPDPSASPQPSVEAGPSASTSPSAAPGPSASPGAPASPEPAAADQVRGAITGIELCLCGPPKEPAFTEVNADDYVKLPDLWWFRTPDGAWECSIDVQASNRAPEAECLSRAFGDQPDAQYPAPAGPDYEPPVDGEAKQIGGLAQIGPEGASYGQYFTGGDNPFSYYSGKGVPGPGRVLSDHQVLLAGGFRCHVDGASTTCVRLSDGEGFTISTTAYALHPRDGAAPDPGIGPTVPTATDVLGPDGYGPLQLGMTVAQAQAADPTLRITSSPRCTYAETATANAVYFNPDGTLSWISPAGNPPTPEGLREGDSVERAYELYAPGQPTLLPEYPSVLYLPVEPGSQDEYAIFFRHPDAGHDDPAEATIDTITLNRNQQCAG